MHLITAALALVAVATAITTAVLASHQQTSTTTEPPPSLIDTVRHIVMLAKTATSPPPASTTPGFKCHNADANIDILVCDFDTKPTFKQAKAIVKEFKSMKATPRYSVYREDTGKVHVFRDGKWKVTKTVAKDGSDVSLQCVPHIYARYQFVYFDFKK